MTTKPLSKAGLAHFTGSEQWFRHGLARDLFPKFLPVESRVLDVMNAS